MLLLGLTGGIGMGKSTVAEYLARRGETLIDTDQLARELVGAGQPALEEIRVEFGPEVFNSDGTLNRSALALVVFADAEKRARLESILHPRIRSRWLAQVEEWRSEGKKRAWIVIPLLFETGAQNEVNLAVCVACSSATQGKRLRERGWTDAEARNRIASQLPISEKVDRADRVIWNESSIGVCEMQAARIVTGL